MIALVLPACYRSHEPATDGGAPTDAPQALAPCTLPVRDWTPTFHVYEGAHGQGAARVHAGDLTWIVASSPRGVEELEVSDGRSAPELTLTRVVIGLVSPEHVVVAASRGADRTLVVTRRRDWTWNHVSDGNAPFVSGLDARHPPPGHVTAAVASPWTASAIEQLPELADVRAHDGTRGRAGVLFDALHASVGVDGSRLAAIVTSASGPSRWVWIGGPHDTWGYDEDRGPLDARLQAVTWDHDLAIGLDEDGVIRAYRSGLPQRTFGPVDPRDGEAPSLFEREGRPWLAVATASGIELWDGEGRVGTRSEAGPDAHAVMAYASATHRGAFALAPSIPALVWVGWSCEP